MPTDRPDNEKPAPVGQLTSLLKSSDGFADYHPFVQQVFTKMATTFDNNPELMTCSTKELIQQHPGTTHEQWRDFLSLPTVDRHIRYILKFESQIAFRKAQKALTTEAAQGNTQAAKQITDISQILQQETNNRTVVLTYVKRPQKEVATTDAN